MLHRMSDPKTKVLRQVPLFAGLSDKELEFIASRADEATVPAGKVLTQQGRPGDTFYILLDGEVEVEVDGKHRRTLGPGSFFGEISMLDRGPGTATITTMKPTRLMVMSHSQFRDAITTDNAILVKVLSVMAERLRADLAAKAKA